MNLLIGRLPNVVVVSPVLIIAKLVTLLAGLCMVWSRPNGLSTSRISDSRDLGSVELGMMFLLSFLVVMIFLVSIDLHGPERGHLRFLVFQFVTFLMVS